MDINILNMSSIETFLDGLLRNKLSKNIFFSRFPKALQKSWSDMVLVDANIDDNGIGRGIVNIFLYAKPLSSSTKNVKKLKQLETTLNTIINSNNDAHYHLTRTDTYSTYDDERQLDCYVVSMIINIV